MVLSALRLHFIAHLTSHRDRFLAEKWACFFIPGAQVTIWRSLSWRAVYGRPGQRWSSGSPTAQENE